MNYSIIYKDFIASRREVELDHIQQGTYTERHHIIPKCWGGSNSNSNVIRLTYEDHVFAHALLIKIAKDGYERWQMSCAMTSILNFDASGQRPEHVREYLNEKYAWARRIYSESVSAGYHPNYDTDIVKLYHVDGRVVHGTRHQLERKIGIPFRRVYDLANGARDFYNGWCRSETEATDRYETVAVFKTRHQRLDGKYYHTDGRVIDPVFCDRKELEALGLTRNVRSRVKNAGFANGWCEDHLEAKMRAKNQWRGYYLKSIGHEIKKDNESFSLFHTSGKTETGTIKELVNKTGLEHMRVNDLVVGRRRYSNGWCSVENEAKRGRISPPGRPVKEKIDA